MCHFCNLHDRSHNDPCCGEHSPLQRVGRAGAEKDLNAYAFAVDVVVAEDGSGDEMNQDSFGGVLVDAPAQDRDSIGGVHAPAQVDVDIAEDGSGNEMDHEDLGGGGVDLPVSDVAEEASSGKELKHWNESLGGVVV